MVRLGADSELTEETLRLVVLWMMLFTVLLVWVVFGYSVAVLCCTRPRYGRYHRV